MFFIYCFHKLFFTILTTLDVGPQRKVIPEKQVANKMSSGICLESFQLRHRSREPLL